MKFLFAVFFLVVAFVRAEVQVEDNVLVLTDANFADVINEHEAMLVEFYAPWCGHCKTLAPEYAKAAKALSGSSAKLAKVDATENTALASQFGIKGFPTLKWFKNGKPTDYNGGRTEAEIVSWINKKSGPAVHTIRTEDDLLKFQESHNVFTLGLFDNADSDAAKKFTQLASSDELHVFAISTEEQVRNKLGVAPNTVVVVKDFDELRSDLSVADGFDSDAVATFVTGSSTPLVQEFTAEASKAIFGNPITKHVLFFTNKNSDHHKTIMDAYRTAASAFKGRLLFVNVPSTENRVMEFFGLTAADVPRTVLADLNPEGGQMKKFMYNGEHSVEAFSAFANQFLAGELVPSLKSEAVAPEDTAGDVVVLRGESFADIVLNNDKDVFVEFYAPWCGHCKKLAPIWDELGAAFATNNNIVVAKMDSTANEIDVPGLKVKGFPTLYFFKGNDKANPIPYEGARELENLEEFVHHTAFHADPAHVHSEL